MSEPKPKTPDSTVQFEKRLLKEENAVRSTYDKLSQDFVGDERKHADLMGISSRHSSTATSLKERIKQQDELSQKVTNDGDRETPLEKQISAESPKALLEELRGVEKHECLEYDDALHHLKLSNADKEFLYKRVLKRKRQNLRNMNDLLPPENPTVYHMTELVRYLSKFVETKPDVDTAVAFNNGRAKVIVIALEARESLNEHKTPSETLLLVLEGHIIIECEGGEHKLGPKDAFDIPEGAPHTVKAVEDSKFLLIH